jgi:hypothetical protein
MARQPPKHGWLYRTNTAGLTGADFPVAGYRTTVGPADGQEFDDTAPRNPLPAGGAVASVIPSPRLPAAGGEGGN